MHATTHALLEKSFHQLNLNLPPKYARLTYMQVGAVRINFLSLASHSLALLVTYLPLRVEYS